MLFHFAMIFLSREHRSAIFHFEKEKYKIFLDKNFNINYYKFK